MANLTQVKQWMTSKHPEIREYANKYISEFENQKINMYNNVSKTGESIKHLLSIIVLAIVAYIIFSTLFHNAKPTTYQAGQINAEAQIDVQSPKVQPLP